MSGRVMGFIISCLGTRIGVLIWWHKEHKFWLKWVNFRGIRANDDSHLKLAMNRISIELVSWRWGDHISWSRETKENIYRKIISESVERKWRIRKRSIVKLTAKVGRVSASAIFVSINCDLIDSSNSFLSSSRNLRDFNQLVVSSVSVYFSISAFISSTLLIPFLLHILAIKLNRSIRVEEITWNLRNCSFIEYYLPINIYRLEYDSMCECRRFVDDERRSVEINSDFDTCWSSICCKINSKNLLKNRRKSLNYQSTVK